MAIARHPTLVIDCSDSVTLANFYGAVLEWKVQPTAAGAQINAEYGDSIGFHKIEDFRPPQWPGQTVERES